MRERCWHRRENIWKPSELRLCHVKTRSILLDVILSPCLFTLLPAAPWLPTLCLLFSINVSPGQRLLQPLSFPPSSHLFPLCFRMLLFNQTPLLWYFLLSLLQGSISEWSVPIFSLISRCFPPWPHQTLCPRFRHHSKNLPDPRPVPVVWIFRLPLDIPVSLLYLKKEMRKAARLTQPPAACP